MTQLLLVEDDEDIRETFADVLRDHGYDVAEAQNGQVALSLLQGGLRPQLILLDYAMPVMDGGEFRKWQLADVALAQLPVVLMTAATGVQAIAAALKPNHLLRKPFSLKELFATLTAALGEGAVAGGPPAPPAAPPVVDPKKGTPA
ncbi:MAG: response regulator [Deltaproteobacteria bacterium]|nr:response regulator [Deltaproteobacteria bacterium]